VITKNFNAISFEIPKGLTPQQIMILKWAVTMYAFVMWPRTTFTFGELADAIPNFYDRSTPQTSEAILVLHAAQDKVPQKGGNV
jgi:hypothetical protein